MLIIGCDYHPGFQQIAMADTEGGDFVERRVESSETEQFYGELQGREVEVGVETSGNMLAFERVMAKYGFRLRIGDAAKIRASDPRKTNNDRFSAQRILKLLLEGHFPDLPIPSLEVRDLRQLLVHRHKLVRMRAQVKNQLQHIALNQGLRLRRKLWTESGRQQIEALELGRWTKMRRDSLLQRLDSFDKEVSKLDALVLQEALKNPQAVLLMTHPGVGPVISLAFVLTIGDAQRFANGKKVAGYLGLAPCENSSGERRRVGSITKQGSTFMRYLLVEGAQTAIRREMGWARAYRRLAKKKQRSGEAKVMVARKLAVRLYWMLRTNTKYPEIVGHARQPESSRGGKTDRLSGHLASRAGA